jgi:hypothetical protein
MRSFTASWIRLAVCFSTLLTGVLTGCDGGSTSATTGKALAPPASTTPDNQAPTIGGAAATSIEAGKAYAFTPTASDAEKDPISFTIANKPAWAAFDADTGALTGTPAAADVGSYADVEIAATDGTSVTSLPQFSIMVAQNAGAGAAVTVGWTPPTQNSDGSTLKDLSGYRIHYGDQPQTYTETVAVSNPGITRFVLDSLPAGKHYLAMTAYNAVGAESDYSPEVTVTVN